MIDASSNKVGYVFPKAVFLSKPLHIICISSTEEYNPNSPPRQSAILGDRPLCGINPADNASAVRSTEIPFHKIPRFIAIVV